MTGTAWISECGRYRYSLTRRFADGLDLVFVMLNPSTADADKDDPTIRRCCGFADRMGFGGIIVVNLFALRAADPKALHGLPEATLCGSENREAISSACHRHSVVLAWGANARRWPKYVREIERSVSQCAREVRTLRRLVDGTPAHPLMLPYSCVEPQEPPR